MMQLCKFENAEQVKALIEELTVKLTGLSPNDRAAVLYVVNGGKPLPVRYELETTSPYYAEKYALALKKILDKFKDSPPNSIVKYKEETYKLKAKSIRNLLYMSWSYLINHLDTEEHLYAELRKRTKIIPNEEGVVLAWKRTPYMASVDKSVQPEFSTIETVIDPQPWKKEVDRFLDEAQENDKMELKVNITHDDVKWLEDYLSDSLDHFVYQINCKKIVLIRNKDLAKAVKDLGLKLENSDLSKASSGNDSRRTSE